MRFINVHNKFMPNNINIEVVHALPEQQKIIQLEVPVDSSIRAAIVHAKIYTGDLENLPVGIFGKLRSLDHVLQHGDRIEIYSPLLIDPKEARIQRVKRDRKNKRKAKAAKSLI